ncbi:hypothetical protein N9L19_00750 [bacterium]|nr:hypothetical protein [bacterium]
MSGLNDEDDFKIGAQLVDIDRGILKPTPSNRLHEGCPEVGCRCV